MDFSIRKLGVRPPDNVYGAIQPTKVLLQAVHYRTAWLLMNQVTMKSQLFSTIRQAKQLLAIQGLYHRAVQVLQTQKLWIHWRLCCQNGQSIDLYHRQRNTRSVPWFGVVIVADIVTLVPFKPPHNLSCGVGPEGGKGRCFSCQYLGMINVFPERNQEHTYRLISTVQLVRVGCLV